MNIMKRAPKKYNGEEICKLINAAGLPNFSARNLFIVRCPLNVHLSSGI
jgi:hypothetical protein